MTSAAIQPVSPDVLSQKAALTPAQKHQKLVEQTRKWVGLTFFAPILKQMREDPLHSDLLDGGRGGQAYGSLYDQQLALRMSRGAGNKLVNGIVRRIEAKAAYAKQQGAAMTYDPKSYDHEGADRLPRPAGAGVPLAPPSIFPESAHVATAF